MSSPKNKRKLQRQSLPHRERIKWEKIQRNLDIMLNRVAQRADSDNLARAIADLKQVIFEKAESRAVDIEIEMSTMSKEYLIDKAMES